MLDYNKDNFDFSQVGSQMLFSISQKLIQHQILNYTDILKWIRKVLTCRNQFLHNHKDYAIIGSNIPICKQGDDEEKPFLVFVHIF